MTPLPYCRFQRGLDGACLRKVQGGLSSHE